MDHFLTKALVSTLAITAVTATPIQRRQTPAPRIDEYITQVKTALYIINSLQTGNFSDSCNDVDLATRLDGYGYDGKYAEQLLCEAAVGILIFTDLNRAETDASNALAALEALQRSDGRLGGPRRVASCGSVGVRTLNEAGLDGASIRDAICRPATETTPLADSTTTTTTLLTSSLPESESTPIATTSSGVPDTFSNTAARKNGTSSASFTGVNTATASSAIVIAPSPSPTAIRSSSYVTGSSGTAIYPSPTGTSSSFQSSGAHSDPSSMVPATSFSLSPYYPYHPPTSANTSSFIASTGTDPNTSSYVWVPAPTNSTASYSPSGTTNGTQITTGSLPPVISLTTAPAYTVRWPSSATASNTSSSTVANATNTTTTPRPPYLSTSSGVYGSDPAKTTMFIPLSTFSASASASIPSGCCGTGPLTSVTANGTNASTTPLPPYLNLTTTTAYTTHWVTGSSYLIPTGIDPASTSSSEDITTVTVDITTTATVFITKTVTPTWNGTGVYPSGPTGRPPWSWTGSWASRTGDYETPTGSTGGPWSTDPPFSTGTVSTKSLPSETRPTGYGTSGSPVTRNSTPSSSTTSRPVYGHGPYGPIWTGKPVWTKGCTDGW